MSGSRKKLETSEEGEREVYLRGSNCRTVTIQDDFGVTKRIRRCN